MNRERGITVLELMIVLVIFGLMLAVSMPGITQLTKSNRLKSETLELVSAMRLARSRSIAEQRDYEMRFDTRGKYSLWIVFDPTSAAGPLKFKAYDLQEGVRIQNPDFFGTSSVTFFPNGSCDASGTVQLADAVAAKTISVLATTGKVTIR